MVMGLMRMMKKLMGEHGLLDKDRIARVKLEDTINKIDMIFIYSLIWTVGGSVDE